MIHKGSRSRSGMGHDTQSLRAGLSDGGLSLVAPLGRSGATRLGHVHVLGYWQAFITKEKQGTGYVDPP